MRAAAVSFLVALLLPGAPFAAEPASDFRPITDFHLTRWTTEEGAPLDTWAITQTADGWLWLGGPQGLFRFDGVEFELVPATGRNPQASTAVYSLFAEESGDLWVGYLYGGITHLVNGAMRHFGEAEGLPAASVFGLARDAGGVLWAGTSAGLMRFDGTRWNGVGPESGFTDRMGMGLEVDGSGALWVIGTERLFRRRAHEARFERTDHMASSASYFLRAVDGSLWYESAEDIRRLPEQESGRPRPPYSNSQRSHTSLFDREGHLWSTPRRGIARIRLPPAATHIRFAQVTLSRLHEREDRIDEYVVAMLEDREGNIWLSTRGGLQRLRHTNIRRLTMPKDDNGYYALAVGDGALWIGMDTGGFRAGIDGVWKYDARLSRVASGLVKGITATDRASDGTLWFAGTEGIWRREAHGGFTRLPDLPAHVRGPPVHAIVVDDTGGPWVSVVQRGLYQLINGQWRPNGEQSALPQSPTSVQTRDAEGRLWFGYRDNRIARVAANEVTMYGEQQGLQLGLIAAIHVGRFTTVAGERAIALFDGRRFHALNAADDAGAFEGVTGIAEALDGDLWLNGSRGAVRVARRDLEEAMSTGHYTVPVEVFDVPDGFPGAAQRTRPLPTLVRGDDGRLWFAGTLGLGWVRPEQLRRNAIPPLLHIRSLKSGGKTYAVGRQVALPVGVHDLELNYTAVSLSRPERIRFRYRLEGYDDAWVDAGSRRQAFYTNLPPGQYRFHVAAANESGVWNETGASMSLAIPPTFVQTRTFLVLCVLAGAFLIWAAIALRVRQATARERSRLQERLGERDRIARELHDTLLQGVQGMILKLQTTVDQADVPPPARRAINEALDRADSLLGEGRDRVKNLRSASAEAQSLKQALLDAAEHLCVDRHERLRIAENGAPRELHPIVREEAARIAIEAISNALRHADAAAIEVELAYERRALRIRVRDDGRGMDAAVVSAGREGHFGITGMKERAKRIRGELSIWSRPEAGTEVKLVVPARIAYVRSSWWKRFMPPHRKM